MLIPTISKNSYLTHFGQNAFMEWESQVSVSFASNSSAPERCPRCSVSLRRMPLTALRWNGKSMANIEKGSIFPGETPPRSSISSLVEDCFPASIIMRAFIPIRVLRDHSKMGEVGQRTETLRVGFQLIESFSQLDNHLIKRRKSQMRELFFAQLFPDMFHRIELGTVSRLSNESNIVWDPEVFGPMPARLIYLHHHKVLGIGARHMLKKQIHHLGIGRRKDE